MTLLSSLGEAEMQVERCRETLSNIADFCPYASFQRLDVS